MNRILVIGCGGAGKSTFARRLGRATGLPVVHLDRHFWKPGWTPTPTAEWNVRVAELIRPAAWILDGNYTGSLGARVAVADAIVFFDVNRATCVAGVLRRFLAHRRRGRPDLPEGCPERIDLAFLRWIRDFPRDTRPRLLAALAGRRPGTPVFRVAGRRAAAEVLGRLVAAHGRHPID